MKGEARKINFNTLKRKRYLGNSIRFRENSVTYEGPLRRNSEGILGIRTFREISNGIDREGDFYFRWLTGVKRIGMKRGDDWIMYDIVYSQP